MTAEKQEKFHEEKPLKVSSARMFTTYGLCHMFIVYLLVLVEMSLADLRV